MKRLVACQIAILCCPELCITGYGCEDAFHSSGVLATAMDMLLEIGPVSRGLVLAVGLPVRWASGVYDGVALFADGNLLEFLLSSPWLVTAHIMSLVGFVVGHQGGKMWSLWLAVKFLW